jgi:hypothetical protein
LSPTTCNELWRAFRAAISSRLRIS